MSVFLKCFIKGALRRLPCWIAIAVPMRRHNTRMPAEIAINMPEIKRLQAGWRHAAA